MDEIFINQDLLIVVKPANVNEKLTDLSPNSLLLRVNCIFGIVCTD